MLLHYYTLHHIAREINDCRGMFLTECFTQERNTLHCVFEDNRRTQVLEAHLDSRHGAVFLRSEFHRARKNTLDLFPELIGRTLQSAELMRGERVLRLVLPPYTLQFIVFAGWQNRPQPSIGEASESISGIVSENVSGIVSGSPAAGNSANALLTLPVESTARTILPTNYPPERIPERIVSAFRAPQILAGRSFELLQHSQPAFEEFPPQTPLLQALAECDLHLGRFYAEQVIMRLCEEDYFSHFLLNGSQTPPTKLCLNDVQDFLSEIKKQAARIQHECLSAREFLVLRDSADKPLFSLIRPTMKADVKVIRAFDFASEAVRTVKVAMQREARFHQMFARTEAALQKTKAKAIRTLEAIQRDKQGAARAQERQLWAEILLSQTKVQQKGLESLETQDWSGESIIIRLNPALTLRENAELYFKKASEGRTAVKKRESRQRQQESLLKNVEEALQSLDSLRFPTSSATSFDAQKHKEQALEKIMMNLGKKSAGNQAQKMPSHQKSTRFREFPLDDDFVLYVGKTAADNDELTVRFAKPNDYWFHARGVPGSHAVLRTSAKDKKPPKPVLEQAAAIAAYFSKARNAKLTPVAYTQKKYVRKPKGAAVGAVVMEREEVIMVRPEVPVGLLGGDDE